MVVDNSFGPLRPKGSKALGLSELTVSFIVVLLNVSQIVVICKLKRRKNFEKVLLSLSLADLLYGSTNAFLGIEQLESEKKQHIFDILYAIHFLCMITSISHLLFIGLDRVWMIIQPLKHNVVMTRKRFNRILLFIWLASIAISVIAYVTTTGPPTPPPKEQLEHQILLKHTPRPSPHLPDPQHSPAPSIHPPHQLPIRGKTQFEIFKERVLSYIIIFAITVLVAIYSFIIKKSREMKRNRGKLSMKCLLVTSCFVIFTLPYPITFLTTGDIQYWTQLLLVSNNGVNSIIYFFISYIERRKERKDNKKIQKNEKANNKQSL